jgi:hypothetical protein
MAGLSFARPLRPADIRVDAMLVDFMRWAQLEGAPGPHRIAGARLVLRRRQGLLDPHRAENIAAGVHANDRVVVANVAGLIIIVGFVCFVVYVDDQVLDTYQSREGSNTDFVESGDVRGEIHNPATVRILSMKILERGVSLVEVVWFIWLITLQITLNGDIDEFCFRQIPQLPVTNVREIQKFENRKSI